MLRLGIRRGNLQHPAPQRGVAIPVAHLMPGQSRPENHYTQSADAAVLPPEASQAQNCPRHQRTERIRREVQITVVLQHHGSHNHRRRQGQYKPEDQKGSYRRALPPPSPTMPPPATSNPGRGQNESEKTGAIQNRRRVLHAQSPGQYQVAEIPPDRSRRCPQVGEV